MRKIVVLSMVLSLFFLGCHKDGIYNPKEKIKTIYLQWENEPKELDQKWTWEKELLTAIELFHNNTTLRKDLYTSLMRKKISKN